MLHLRIIIWSKSRRFTGVEVDRFAAVMHYSRMYKMYKNKCHPALQHYGALLTIISPIQQKLDNKYLAFIFHCILYEPLP